MIDKDDLREKKLERNKRMAKALAADNTIGIGTGILQGQMIRNQSEVNVDAFKSITDGSVIYIAGKITGTTDYMKKFKDAQNMLEGLGFIVLNPSMLPKGLKPKEYMQICLPMLDIASVLFHLKGWEDSGGANIEHAYAMYSEKRMVYQQ